MEDNEFDALPAMVGIWIYQLHTLNSGRSPLASRGCKAACVGSARLQHSTNGRTGGPSGFRPSKHQP